MRDLMAEARELIEFQAHEISALRKAVANQSGDNSCHLAGSEVALPPWPEFSESCRRHWTQVTDKCGVLDGCRTIAQLESEVASLKHQIALEIEIRYQNRKQIARECAEIADEVSDECANAGIAGPWDAPTIRKWGRDACEDIATRIRKRFFVSREER